MPPHCGRFALGAQLYLAVVVVVTMGFSARVAPKKRIADLGSVVARRKCHHLVRDLLALFDVHDVVALVNYDLTLLNVSLTLRLCNSYIDTFKRMCAKKTSP